ncbi:MAG TPA: cytochrome P450 [Polyangia bacterium]|jgi:cytochrome P450|nr:cytochrome P450 [Polyangia bacterium]
MQDPNKTGEAVPQIDFQDPAFFSNPFPALARLRRTGPLMKVQLTSGVEAWLITRYDEALQVLKEARFVVQPQNTEGRLFEMPPILQKLIFNNVVAADPPRHTQLRALVSKAFNARFIESLRPHIQEITDHLIDEALPRGQMDLIEDFAFPLPITVIAEMLGVPVEDRNRIRIWSQAIFNTIGGGGTAEDVVHLEEFSTYVENLVEGKRREPRDDLISHMVQAEESGTSLSQVELVSMVTLLIFAGHETTVNLIGNGMLALLTHPAELAKLRQDLTLVPAAIEEILRYCGPAIAPGPRYASEDVEIGGHLIRKGDAVLVSLAAANRDQAWFQHCETFDITRSDEGRHMAFGYGIHYCLGAPLARLEGDIALTTLLRRLPNLRLAVPPETLRWRGNANLRGLCSLPVAF